MPSPDLPTASRRSALGGTWLRRRVRVPPPAVRVWVFSTCLAALAAILYFALISGAPAPRPPLAVPWWVVAIGFCLADIKVIEVHFRRESHAFSLSEVPAVIGLFFLPPGPYLLALTLGAGVALLFTPSRTPLKLAFNMANYLLVAVLMLAVFHAIDRSPGSPGALDYLAGFAAAGAGTIVGAVTIATVITLSGGAPQFKKLPDMLQFGLLVAMANTSISLLAVTLLWFAPSALWLLVIPLATLFLAYRAWVSEREKHERLELVYQSSRILQHSPELDVALVALLDHARTMFRAELAEVVLKAGDPAAQTLRTTSIQDEPSELLVAVPAMVVDPQVRAVISERRAAIASPARTPGGREIVIRQAMVAPLVGEAGVMGLFTIVNRLTEGTGFGADDLRLLETLANQAAVALENGQLEQSLAELSRLKEQLRHQAYHDPLTNLPNRAMFLEAATAEIRNQRPDGERPVILLLDLDDFKHVNDTLGHAAGDELLIMVTERIQGCLRDHDLAARLGGDEFAILIRDTLTLSRSVAIADRLIKVLGAAFPIMRHEVLVGASVGIAVSVGQEQPAGELLSEADVAMYAAKTRGRHRFAVFDPTMHAAIIARHELSADLTRSIERSELVVLHQPIVDLTTGRTVGVEALVRWRHPSRGLVLPEEFISLAEESGSIVPLGQFVMVEAAAQIHEYNLRAGANGVFLSLNVSAVQLQQPDFLETVVRASERTGLPLDQLVVEITETAMFHDTETTIDRLQALRALGIRIAIDDFGTGYSSLTYLRRFPVDILKIAKDFIEPTGSHRQEWAFTGAILALGRRLGLTVVAEGIEDPGQVERLRAMGCELGQGFLFAQPSTLAELVAVGQLEGGPPANRRAPGPIEPASSPRSAA